MKYDLGAPAEAGSGACLHEVSARLQLSAYEGDARKLTAQLAYRLKDQLFIRALYLAVSFQIANAVPYGGVE